MTHEQWKERFEVLLDLFDMYDSELRELREEYEKNVKSGGTPNRKEVIQYEMAKVLLDRREEDGRNYILYDADLDD